MMSGIVLRSAPGEPEYATLDAQQPRRTMQCNDVDASTAIEGITFARGRAGWGSAIDCYQASPRISNCVLEANTADLPPFFGGAVYCYVSSPTFDSCRFIGNESSCGGGHPVWPNSRAAT